MSDSDQLDQQQNLENIQWMDDEITAAPSSNTTAQVLVSEEPVAQNSSTENQSLVTDMLACSKGDCDFKTKQKRYLDMHIKGN